MICVGGYYLWLRDSSLLAIEKIEVVGATTAQAEISEALASAATGMTTLNIDEQRLAEAVSPFPSVRAISTDASIPHDLTVEIHERVPIALVTDGTGKVPVAEDGLVVPGLPLPEGRKLPVLEAGVRRGGRLDEDGRVLALAIAAAPAKLAADLRSGAVDPELGIVLGMRGGLELRFGDPERAEAKWRAVKLVFADPEFGAPSYLDVSVPERPVTG